MVYAVVGGIRLVFEKVFGKKRAQKKQKNKELPFHGGNKLILATVSPTQFTLFNVLFLVAHPFRVLPCPVLKDNE